MPWSGNVAVTSDSTLLILAVRTFSIDDEVVGVSGIHIPIRLPIRGYMPFADKCSLGITKSKQVGD